MPSEQQILKLIRKLTPNSKKYLHDDAAIIEKNLIVTTDSLVENTHFTLKRQKPNEIGWKALAVNLSDIAAMGGKPLYAIVALTFPKDIKLSWIKRFYNGLVSCGKKYKTKIIGGNLARGKEINITITIIGKTKNNIAKRSNAKTGDIVFVTGTFGDGLYKKLFPRVQLGQKIIKLSKQVSLMDSSDGLADCLIQIANESKVKIIVNENKIPISNQAKKIAKKLRLNPLELALYRGEDYELVGTINKRDFKKLNKIKVIGTVTKGKGAFLKHKDGKLVKLDMNKAFKHFN